MTRHLSHFATEYLPTRTVRIVRGRDIREVEMGSGSWCDDRRAVTDLFWPTKEEWDRLMRERAAVNL